MAQKFEILFEAKMALDSLKKSVGEMKNIFENQFTQIKAPKGITDSLQLSFKKLTKSTEDFSSRVQQGFTSMADVNKAKSALSDLIRQYDSLNDKLEAVKLDPSKLFPDDVKQKLKALENAYNKVSTEINNIDLDSEKGKKSTAFEEKNKQVDELRNKVDALKKSLKELNADNDTRNTQKAGLENKLPELKKARDAAKSNVDSIRTERETRKTNYENYIKERNEIDATIKKLKEAKKAKQEYNEEDLKAAEQKRQDLDKAAEEGGYKTQKQTQFGNLGEAVKEYNAADQAVKDNEAAQKRLQTELEKTNSKIKQQKTELADEEGNLRKASDEADGLKKALENFDIDFKTEKLEKLKEAFQAQGIDSKDLSGLKSLEDFDALLNKMNTERLDKVKPALEAMGLELQNLDGQIKVCTNELDANSAAMERQNEAAREIDGIKNRITQFFGLANAVNIARRAIQNAINTVKELDKTMTETAVVTEFNVSDMWDQLPDYTARANELGVATNEAYAAATLFYQQGLKTNEVIGVSTETLKMARIAGMDAAAATDAMTAALRGFNMEVNQASAERVNDVYSKLAAITASNTQEISTAMSKVASLAHNANMEFESTAAFLAQVIETTRESAETAGTALKTVIARFSEVKSLYSKDQLFGTDEEGQEIDVNKVSTALRSAGINLNEYLTGAKGLDDIFMELAAKWDSLDDVQQRYIATMAAGSRQQSRFIAMMSDYGRTVELVEAANNSAGASQGQFEKTLESLDAKLTQLKNAWDAFTLSLANSDVIKGVVTLLTELLQATNAVTGAFGNTGGAIAKLFLGFGAFKIGKSFFNKFFDAMVSQFFNTGKIAGQKTTEGMLAGLKQSRAKLDSGFKAIYKGKEISSLYNEIYFKDLDLDKIKGKIKELKIPIKIDDIKTGEDLSKLSDRLKPYGMQLDAVNGKIKAVTLSQEEMAQRGVNAFMTMSTAAAGLSAVLGLVSTAVRKLGNEKLADGIQTVSTAFGVLAGILAVIPPILKVIGKEALLAQACFGPIAIIGAALAAVVGILWAINDAQETAEEKTKRLGDEAKEAADKFNALNDAVESFPDKYKALDEMTVGTTEWKNAVVDLNDSLLELFDLYPELAKFATPDKDGVFRLDFNSVEVQKVLSDAADERASAQNNVLIDSIEKSQESREKLLQELTRAMSKAGIQVEEGKDLESIENDYVELLKTTGYAYTDDVIERFINVKKDEIKADADEKILFSNLINAADFSDDVSSAIRGAIGNDTYEAITLGLDEDATEDEIREELDGVIKGAAGELEENRDLANALSGVGTALTVEQFKGLFNPVTDNAGNVTYDLDENLLKLLGGKSGIETLIGEYEKQVGIFTSKGLDEELEKFDIGLIQGLSGQISSMGEKDAQDYIAAFQSAVESADNKKLVESYLSTVDWSNAMDAINAMDFMKSQGMDQAEIEDFWNAATKGAHMYVKTEEEATRIAEMFQKKLQQVSEIEDRLISGKGTQDDINTLLMVDSSIADSVYWTADGWKLVEEKTRDATEALREYYALESRNTYQRQIDRANEVEEALRKVRETFGEELDEDFEFESKKVEIRSGSRYYYVDDLEESSMMSLLERFEYIEDAEKATVDELNEAYQQMLKDISEGTAAEQLIEKMDNGMQASTLSGQDALGLEQNRGQVLDTMIAQVDGLDLAFEEAKKDLDGLGEGFDEGIKAHVVDVNRANKAMDEFNKALSENAESLKNPGTDEYRAALSKITTEAKKVWKNISGVDKVLSEHTDLLLQMAEGGETAENAYQELGKFMANEFLDSLDPLTVGIDQIRSMMAALDGAQLEVGGTADFGNIYDNLESVNASAKDTAAALEAMGYEVTWISKDGVPIEIGDQTVGQLSEYEMVVTKTGAAGTGSSKKSGGGGGGGGSSKEWENPYDELYNLTQKINEQLRIREKLERKYDLILKNRSQNAQDTYENMVDQIKALEKEKSLQEEMLERRTQQAQKYMSENASLNKYGELVFGDDGTLMVQIDWDLIDSVKDTERGEAIEKYISKLEEIEGEIEDARDGLDDIEDRLLEIYELGKDEYFDFEDRVKEAIVDARQKEIDELNAINDSINDTNSKLIDSIQKEIDKQRKDRENERTEEDIADKQRRLTYLEMDTSGANAMEILKLQEEINNAQESYTDQLIDQKISELQEQNDLAAEQREKQIAILETQLEHEQQMGLLWEQVWALVDAGVTQEGKLVQGSDLELLLKSADGFLGLSTLSKMEWLNELENNLKLVMNYLRVGRSTEALLMKGELQQGQQVSFSKDGQMITGKVGANGVLTDAAGNKYRGVYQDSTGNFVFDENSAFEEYVAPKPATSTSATATTTTPSKTVKYRAVDGNGAQVGGIYSTAYEARAELEAAKSNAKAALDLWTSRVNQETKGLGGPSQATLEKYAAATRNYNRLKAGGVYQYKTGGLADYTGPAWLDGTPSKPEIVLNQQDSKNFMILKDVLSSLLSRSTTTSESNGDNYFDVDINVERMDSDYDVEQVASKVKRLIQDDALYRNVNVVSNKR